MRADLSCQLGRRQRATHRRPGAGRARRARRRHARCLGAGVPAAGVGGRGAGVCSGHRPTHILWCRRPDRAPPPGKLVDGPLDRLLGGPVEDEELPRRAPWGASRAHDRRAGGLTPGAGAEVGGGDALQAAPGRRRPAPLGPPCRGRRVARRRSGRRAAPPRPPGSRRRARARAAETVRRPQSGGRRWRRGRSSNSASSGPTCPVSPSMELRPRRTRSNGLGRRAGRPRGRGPWRGCRSLRMPRRTRGGRRPLPRRRPRAARPRRVGGPSVDHRADAPGVAGQGDAFGDGTAAVAGSSRRRRPHGRVALPGGAATLPPAPVWPATRHARASTDGARGHGAPHRRPRAPRSEAGVDDPAESGTRNGNEKGRSMPGTLPGRRRRSGTDTSQQPTASPPDCEGPTPHQAQRAVVGALGRDDLRGPHRDRVEGPDRLHAGDRGRRGRPAHAGGASDSIEDREVVTPPEAEGASGRRIEGQPPEAAMAVAGSSLLCSSRARSWLMICGCASPPIAPTRWVRAPSGRRHEHGGEGVRWPLARGHFSWVARHQGEPDAAYLCRKTPGRRFDQMGAEVRARSTGSRRSRGRRRPWRRGVWCRRHRGAPPAPPRTRCPEPRRVARARLSSTRWAALSRRPGCKSAVAVGAVEQDVGPVVPDGPPAFDEEVGPAGLVGFGPEARRLGDPGAGQREVALGRWWHRPEFVSPGPDAEGVHAHRRGSGEVLGMEAAAGEARASHGRTHPRRRRPSAVTCYRGESVLVMPGRRTALADVERLPSLQSLARRRGARGRDNSPAPACDGRRFSPSARSIVGASTSSRGSRP